MSLTGKATMMSKVGILMKEEKANEKVKEKGQKTLRIFWSRGAGQGGIMLMYRRILNTLLDASITAFKDLFQTKPKPDELVIN